MKGAVRIVGSGALCAIGTTVAQVWAAVRAGISRSSSSPVHNQHFAPMTMALLPDDVLAELPVLLREMPLTAAQRRMIRLASPALSEAFGEAMEAQATPVPLFLGLPEIDATGPIAPIDPNQFLRVLVHSSGCAIDPKGSLAFPTGRAASMQAVEAAVAYLSAGPNRTAMVGGVDTFLDLRRLSKLDAEKRILGEQTMDGFTPGEGAAFLLLTNEALPEAAPLTRLVGVATAQDAGHRYSEAPGTGEGLANAIEAMRPQLDETRAAQTVFAGLNGEGLSAKEWGVAHLRHRDILSPDAAFEHPADRFGDVGAAMGAMLLVLADAALLQGHREGPALVWASSDRELCGCAWLDAAAQPF